MTPDERHQADRLGAYADRWLDGQIDEPTTAEEATFAHLQRMLGTTPSASTTQPITRQENPMLPIASIQPSPLPTSNRHRTPVMTTLARWQPVFSMAVMFAILAGLVGFAYTGLNRQDREPESTMLAALQDDATPASEACTPPPPSASDEEIRSFSFDDWSSPQYYATGFADDELADRAIQLLEDFWRCADAEPDEAWDSSVADYFSTRAQHVAMYDELGPDQQAAIQSYSCLFRERDVLEFFPITLNTQLLAVDWQGYPFNLWDRADVYLLADGRYGMANGNLSSNMIRDPSIARSQDYLWFVAFVEEEGQLYIDESFYAFTGDPSLYSYGQMRGDCD